SPRRPSSRPARPPGEGRRRRRGRGRGRAPRRGRRGRGGGGKRSCGACSFVSRRWVRKCYNITFLDRTPAASHDSSPMSPRLHTLIDRFGATGSLVCAVHCALLPLLLAAIPTLGVSEWMGDRFEMAFVLFA